MKKYKVVIKEPDTSKIWVEVLELNEEHPLQEAINIVGRFNSSLRSGEHIRKVVYVRTTNAQFATTPHSWSKTSLVTERGGFDKMKCENCGVTGKRFGMGTSGTRIDLKYKADKYATCDWALQRD